MDYHEISISIHGTQNANDFSDPGIFPLVQLAS